MWIMSPTPVFGRAALLAELLATSPDFRSPEVVTSPGLPEGFWISWVWIIWALLGLKTNIGLPAVNGSYPNRPTRSATAAASAVVVFPLTTTEFLAEEEAEAWNAPDVAPVPPTCSEQREPGVGSSSQTVPVSMISVLQVVSAADFRDTSGNDSAMPGGREAVVAGGGMVVVPPPSAGRSRCAPVEDGGPPPADEFEEGGPPMIKSAIPLTEDFEFDEEGPPMIKSAIALVSSFGPVGLFGTASPGVTTSRDAAEANVSIEVVVVGVVVTPVEK